MTFQVKSWYGNYSTEIMNGTEVMITKIMIWTFIMIRTNPERTRADILKGGKGWREGMEHGISFVFAYE